MNNSDGESIEDESLLDFYQTAQIDPLDLTCNTSRYFDTVSNFGDISIVREGAADPDPYEVYEPVVSSSITTMDESNLTVDSGMLKSISVESGRDLPSPSSIPANYVPIFATKTPPQNSLIPRYTGNDSPAGILSNAAGWAVSPLCANIGYHNPSRIPIIINGIENQGQRVRKESSKTSPLNHPKSK